MSIAGARTQAHHHYRGVTTVIRQAIETHPEANAKLGNIKYADGVGDAPYFVPELQFGAVRPSHQRIGRTGSSSAFGQKRCAPHAEISLSLVRITRSCSRIQSRGDSKDNGVPRVVIPLCERAKSASQTRQTGDRATARYASSQRAMTQTTWQTLSTHG